MSMLPVTEADLHAYVDGQLPVARCAEVEAYLASFPQEAERINAYRGQNTALHALYDPVFNEVVPERFQTLSLKTRPMLCYAAMVGWIVLGGVAGWTLRGGDDTQIPEPVVIARQAAIAHAVYSPEVRHPVEVGADQEAHLVGWLSKRLGANLKLPQLSSIGFSLVGGRLLPGDKGPVAQFMYQDGQGQRLTLYVRTDAVENKETAFRYAREGNVSVFYWLDGKFGYALSGEIDKAELLRVAKVVYQQLNP
ncbi:MAG: anti-sigma factor [Betaproteobacteria bacterium]|nr:anti-sigma factor [Betaproteobacteria bacterium]